MDYIVNLKLIGNDYWAIRSLLLDEVEKEKSYDSPEARKHAAELLLIYRRLCKQAGGMKIER